MPDPKDVDWNSLDRHNLADGLENILEKIRANRIDEAKSDLSHAILKLREPKE